MQDRAARESSSFIKVLVGGLAVMATILLATHAVGAEEAGHATVVQPGPGDGQIEDRAPHRTTTARAGLPFVGADLVILVLGWVIVVVAAAGAPRLLQPRRRIAPVLVGASDVPEPCRPVTGKGAPAHAHA